MRWGTSDDGCQIWCRPVNELSERSVNEQNKGCAYIHSGIDVARTVQRIETDNIRSIQMVGGQNKLFLLLAIDSSNLNTASFDFMSQSATFGDACTSPQFLRK